MCRATQTLPLSPDAIWKHLADINPNYSALRDGEKGDVRNQQPNQIGAVTLRKENRSNTSERSSCADGADEKKGLAPDLVD